MVGMVGIGGCVRRVGAEPNERDMNGILKRERRSWRKCGIEQLMSERGTMTIAGQTETDAYLAGKNLVIVRRVWIML